MGIDLISDILGSNQTNSFLFKSVYLECFRLMSKCKWKGVPEEQFKLVQFSKFQDFCKQIIITKMAGLDEYKLVQDLNC